MIGMLSYQTPKKIFYPLIIPRFDADFFDSQKCEALLSIEAIEEGTYAHYISVFTEVEGIVHPDLG